MRIALSLDFYDTRLGGMQKWVDGFARFLAGRGHDVHVVTFANRSQSLPATVHVIDDPGGILDRARAIEAKFVELAADVTHDSGSALQADIYQPATGSALFSESRFLAASGPTLKLRAAISPRSILRRRQLRMLESIQVRQAGTILAVSSLVRQLLARTHGIDEKRIAVVHNGVDTSHFDARRIGHFRKAQRAALGNRDHVVFLMVANNLLLKGADIAVRAFASLRRKEGRECTLIIAGGLPDNRMKKLVSQSGAGDSIKFLGHIEDIAPVYVGADVFLHPTRWDTCSLVTSEAMACSLPVITSAMNGASEFITDRHDGFVMPDPENVNLLANLMTQVLDQSVRRRIGTQARHRIERYDLLLNYNLIESHLLDRAKQNRRQRRYVSTEGH